MFRIVGGIVVAVVCLLGVPAEGWWGDGHGILTEGAVLALPEEVPAFFREGGGVASNVVFDPDLFMNRGVSTLNHAEHGEHYFDLEYLQGRAIPAKRYDFIALCQELELDPERVGLVPYAITEWTERLAVAFAEHRKWPDNEAVQQKCLVYAGFIAHYAEDICQPLHVTVHFNGKKQQDGTVVGKGIHEQVDSSVERLGFTARDLAAGQEVAAFDSLMGSVIEQIEESNGLVEEVYGLMGKWEDESNAQVQALAKDRARTAVRFTASLYLTAWRKSEGIRLPGWLER
ncbi:MAG: hypothetical protein VX293_02930 [Candidatus Latescibacterota bacterium]|nr:hypothetical protein [Candidatus Latescibacterota bacterium]